MVPSVPGTGERGDPAHPRSAQHTWEKDKEPLSQQTERNEGGVSLGIQGKAPRRRGHLNWTLEVR